MALKTKASFGSSIGHTGVDKAHNHGEVMEDQTMESPDSSRHASSNTSLSSSSITFITLLPNKEKNIKQSLGVRLTKTPGLSRLF